jgi:hypothetical protein
VSRRFASVLLALSLAALPAPSSRAADADVRMLQLQVDIERRLLDAAAQRWSERLEAERRAAQAVESAAASLQLALRRGGVAPGSTPATAPPTVQAAAATLEEAERALAGALQAKIALGAAFDGQAVRVSALEAALVALSGRVSATPLDGTWDLLVEPGRRGSLHLTQVGTLVTGDYSMMDGASGSVTGTFAAGRLRLDRIDATAGKDAMLEGVLTSGRLEGTWLATIFGRGTAESGAWSARRRSDLPPPEPAAEPEP